METRGFVFFSLENLLVNTYLLFFFYLLNKFLQTKLIFINTKKFYHDFNFFPPLPVPAKAAVC